MTGHFLTAQYPPAERSFVPPTFVGTPEAIAAARAGDVKRLDDLELAWLNAWGPKPAVEPDSLHLVKRGPELQPLAVAISRGAGPRGETIVEWSMVKPCAYCWRRPTQRRKCAKCHGHGFAGQLWESVHTTIDGRIVEIA